MITDHFPMHNEREEILKAWNKHGLRFSVGMVTNDFEKHMLPMNYIRDYYGEKIAFYFCWIVHYTGWLMIPAVTGIIMTIIMLATREKEDGFYATFNTEWNGLYAFILVIWTTLFIESWKRKQNVLASYWHVRNAPEANPENPNFVSATEINEETKTKWRINPTNTYRNQLLIGIPVVCLYIGIVILI